MESARVKNYIAVLRDIAPPPPLYCRLNCCFRRLETRAERTLSRNDDIALFLSPSWRDVMHVTWTRRRSRKPRQRENFSFDLDVRFSKRCNPVNRYGRLKHTGCVAETRNHIPRNELIVNVRTIANEISLIYLLHILLDTINRERRNSWNLDKREFAILSSRTRTHII